LRGFSYDTSGNTTNDGVNSYTWDAESQLKSGGGVNYLYDGDGRRVSKSSGKLYWYGSGGDILAETDASGNTTAEYIFFGGQRIAMLPAGGNPIYYVEDLLGTSRVITTNTGVVCYDADFYPYGGERTITNTCPQNNYKFEGKERDTETGNDDFGARYYSNRFGRWLSADWSAVPVPVPYANLTNPQTLNLYSMVADDPESFADLDGHDGDKSGTTGSGQQQSPGSGGCPAATAHANSCEEIRSGDNADKAQNQSQDQTQQNQQNQQPPQQPSAASVGIAALPILAGAGVGALEGGEGGAAVGTVEPGGGNVVGAVVGAAAGAAVAALAPTIYSKSKEALKKVGSQLERALDHVGKLNGPDQNPNPRGGWKQTIRDAANQIDKQAGRISNQNLSNAARFTAQLLRGLVD
jgi:RHS repeat-associated protein